MKPCKVCGESDPNAFYVDKKGKRTNASCKECCKSACKERWHSRSMDDKRAYNAQKYGISPEQYLAMVDAQDGKCAICHEVPSSERGLHVDHCHESGEVRGLLCHHCNVGLGAFRDSQGLLQSAASYLCKEHTLPAVDEEKHRRESRLFATNTSGARGVYWREDSKMWRVIVHCLGKLKPLGQYKDFELAALVADEANRKYRNANVYYP